MRALQLEVCCLVCVLIQCLFAPARGVFTRRFVRLCVFVFAVFLLFSLVLLDLAAPHRSLSALFPQLRLKGLPACRQEMDYRVSFQGPLSPQDAAVFLFEGGEFFVKSTLVSGGGGGDGCTTRSSLMARLPTINARPLFISDIYLISRIVCSFFFFFFF